MWRIVLSVVCLAGCDVIWRIDPLTNDAASSGSNDGGGSGAQPFARYTMDTVGVHTVPDALGTASRDAYCNDCPTAVAGHIDGALAFNVGSSLIQFLTIDSDSLFEHMTAFSVAGWVNLASINEVACVFSKPFGPLQTNTWQFCVDAGGVPEFFSISPDGQDALAPTGPDLISMAANTWYHVAITFDGNQKLIWIDGATVASRPSAPFSVDQSPVVIGGDLDNRTDFLAPVYGSIDDVQFYAVALTKGDIARLIAGI
jgi:hypothetical protein